MLKTSMDLFKEFTMHHLFTAPNCLRCKIVKAFLESKGQEWKETDFQADKEDFNTFYRANRPSIYRNPEGVEFPIYSDGNVVKQGSGEVIAYLLSEGKLDTCITRSDLLHGAISGLYPSLCPEGQEAHFIELLEHLAKGGLTACLRVDGRKPELLQTLIEKGLVSKLEVNFYGAPEIYAMLPEGAELPAPTEEEIAKTVEIAKNFKESEIRLHIVPLNDNGTYRYITKQEASKAAEFISTACNDKQLEIVIAPCLGEELLAIGLNDKLEEIENPLLLKIRSGLRDFLFKADIKK